MDVDHHPRAIDVADLEMQPLAEPEPQRVNGAEIGPIMGRADGGDEVTDLIDGADLGEPLLPGAAEAFQGRPIAGDGVRIEELDTAVSDAEGGGGELAIVLEVEEVVAELRFGEPVGWGLEVIGELSDGAKVRLLGAL